MHRGEFLTRLTVWLALCAYAIGVATLLLARRRPGWLAFARKVWTIGCALFLAHVACAFSYYHGWSHAAAYRETARETAQMTGFDWGGGLFLNYLFALVWLADVVRRWWAPGPSAARWRHCTGIFHGFLFFMVFNGTVVFGHGPVRWLGFAICAGLAGTWWWSARTPRPIASAR